MLAVLTGIGVFAQVDKGSELELEYKVADLAKRVGDPTIVTSTFYQDYRA